MHELPKDLSNSLRSWRGSIYGSVRKSPSDLEKGAGDIDDKAFDQALGATQSSLVLVSSWTLPVNHQSFNELTKVGDSTQQHPRKV